MHMSQYEPTGHKIRTEVFMPWHQDAIFTVLTRYSLPNQKEGMNEPQYEYKCRLHGKKHHSNIQINPRPTNDFKLRLRSW